MGGRRLFARCAVWRYSSARETCGLRKAFGETEDAAFRHLHEGKSLSAGYETGGIGGTFDGEFHPEPGSFDFGDMSADFKLIAKNRGAEIINLGANDDWVNLRAADVLEVHAELDGEEGAGLFDEA